MPLCPVCGNELNVGDVELHEIVECPRCGAELEVVSVSPLLLDELPPIEEDWGE